MMGKIVFGSDFVTLIGGGAVYPGDLDVALAHAPQVVCADGGAKAALAAGLAPRAVIGDFDSLSDESRAQLSPQSLIHVAEQDSTDFEKALTRISTPLVIGVGFTGARLDHTLAVLHVMLRYPDRAVVLLAEEEIVLLAPPRLEMDLPEGATVSLFPLRRCTGRSEGLYWPIDGLEMAPGEISGTSNQAIGGRMVLEMERPGMILFLPKDQLGAVIPVLTAWPAPGQPSARA